MVVLETTLFILLEPGKRRVMGTICRFMYLGEQEHTCNYYDHCYYDRLTENRFERQNGYNQIIN